MFFIAVTILVVLPLVIMISVIDKALDQYSKEDDSNSIGRKHH